MNHQSFRLLLILATMLVGSVAYGQGSLGPTPKKARTPEDYQPRTLKEVAERIPDAKSRGDADDKVIVYGDIFPSRVRTVFKGAVRALPQTKKDVLHRWAQLYAGAPETYTLPYQTELLFGEDGQEFWLAVRKQSVAQLEKEVKKGETLDLFLIRLGGSGTAAQWEPLLLVESFQKAK